MSASSMVDPIDGPALIVDALKTAGVNFVVSLPDVNLSKLLAAIDAQTDLPHVTLCREEEGIGICTGAYIGGRTAAIVMQNGGLLNSCNALTTTALNFNIPLLLLIYYAGDIGDEGFATLGSVTEPVLRGLGIRYFLLRKNDEIPATIKGAVTLAVDSRRPIAVLMNKDVLGMRR